MIKSGKGERKRDREKEGIDKLEAVISYILIGGVILSMVLIGIGLMTYYIPKGIGSSPHYTMKWKMSGSDFFAYVTNTILNFNFSSYALSSSNEIKLMAIGIIILIITPFTRVIASVIFFGISRNLKYLFITSFVLILLTFSLTTH